MSVTKSIDEQPGLLPGEYTIEQQNCIKHWESLTTEEIIAEIETNVFSDICLNDYESESNENVARKLLEDQEELAYGILSDYVKKQSPNLWLNWNLGLVEIAKKKFMQKK